MTQEPLLTENIPDDKISSINEDVVIEPIPQGKPDEKKEDGVDVPTGQESTEKISYEKLTLLFGSYIHLLVQRKLEGDNSEEAMEKFKESMLGTLGEKGEVIFNNLNRVTDEAVLDIRKKNPKGYSPAEYFSELPFMPSSEQVAIIEQAIQNKAEMTTLLNKYYQSSDGNPLKLGEGLRDSLYDPNFVLTTAQGYKLGLPQIRQIALTSTESFLSSEEMEVKRLSDLITAISTYQYLNFMEGSTATGGIDLEKLEEVPAKYRKLIVSASSKPDLIGMSAKEGDVEAQNAIADFKEEIKGPFFGYTPLHSINTLESTVKDGSKMSSLLNMIMEGRIAVITCEIKTQVLNKVIKISQEGELSESKTVFNKIDSEKDRQFPLIEGKYIDTGSAGKLLKAHYDDVAHTLFAIYQSFSAIGDAGTVEAMRTIMGLKEKLRQLPEEEATTYYAQALNRFAPLLNLLGPPHQHTLLRIYAPFINSRRVTEKDPTSIDGLKTHEDQTIIDIRNNQNQITEQLTELDVHYLRQVMTHKVGRNLVKTITNPPKK